MSDGLPEDVPGLLREILLALKAIQQSQAAPPQPAASPRMLTTEQFCEMLGTSQDTLARLVKAGKAPAPTRLGRELRWPASVVEAWIAAGMPATNTSTRRSRASLNGVHAR